VAVITGDHAICKRELEHVKKSGRHRAEADEIEKELMKRQSGA
jgi:hypothetical protein